ncbi:hypothetical protein Z043_109849 [Scleropages formosus]|uniref:39S ribosomal protein L23, mitochondrial n=1 Tax=Scleropages formosus TaxID=113540 RepID=A0A0P7VDF9_SCLFO|nr:hypothetical protein Z043_109849 [Scleropages formosus]
MVLIEILLAQRCPQRDGLCSLYVLAGRVRMETAELQQRPSSALPLAVNSGFCLSPPGTNKKRNHLNQRVKRPDYKVAYVQLAQQQTFQFPDIFPKKESQPEEGSMEAIQEKFMEDEQQRQKPDPRRGGVPEWFGI